jgi:hypothetical protein
MTNFRQLCGLLIAAFLVTGCSSGQDLNLAQTEIERFRQLMAAQQFGQIYSEASDELKKTAGEQDMVRLLTAIDRKLGPVKSAAKDGWNVHYSPSGTSATLKFNTQFERGTGAETFVYRIAGGKAQLAGYNITSNALITN